MWNATIQVLADFGDCRDSVLRSIDGLDILFGSVGLDRHGQQGKGIYMGRGLVPNHTHYCVLRFSCAVCELDHIQGRALYAYKE